MRVFHKSLNAAVTDLALRGGKTCLSPCILLSDCILPCRSGSPDPDPFGIRRSRTTEVGPMRTGIRPPSKAG